MNKYIDWSGSCHPINNGNNVFEVTQRKHYRFGVDLNRNNCTCGYWQVSGMPCAHAIAAIHTITSDLTSYIASCFYVEAFKRTYAHCLQPVNGMDC